MSHLSLIMIIVTYLSFIIIMFSQCVRYLSLIIIIVTDFYTFIINYETVSHVSLIMITFNYLSLIMIIAIIDN